MNNNITNKKYFETILLKSNQKATYMLRDENLDTISSYEDKKYIGFECKSNITEIKCKICGRIITKVKDIKITYPMHGIINNKPVLLKLHKKLFYCGGCNKSTIEQPIQIKEYAQKTDGFIKMMIEDLKEQTTYSIVSRRYKVSVTNVIYQFDLYREEIKKQSYKDITKIAIDEVRFIPTVGNYQVVIMNHENGEIVDILENRYGKEVKAYLEKNLPHIELISQDFWEPYKNATEELNNPVTIVADKFHFARFASWGFNRTRVQLQKQTGLKLGKSWKLQTKSRHKLDIKCKRKVDKIVNQHPKLVAAYKAKNYFFAIMRMNSKESYIKHIKKWQQYIHFHNLTEFYFIETTLNNWHNEIINMFESPYSNGSIERINRTIKQAKNIAFGFKNLERATALLKMRVAS